MSKRLNRSFVYILMFVTVIAALSAGVFAVDNNKIEWMGHADIKMTADIYGHLDTARKQGMADKLSSSLFQ